MPERLSHPAAGQELTRRTLNHAPQASRHGRTRSERAARDSLQRLTLMATQERPAASYPQLSQPTVAALASRGRQQSRPQRPHLAAQSTPVVTCLRTGLRRTSGALALQTAEGTLQLNRAQARLLVAALAHSYPASRQARPAATDGCGSRTRTRAASFNLCSINRSLSTQSRRRSWLAAD